MAKSKKCKPEASKYGQRVRVLSHTFKDKTGTILSYDHTFGCYMIRLDDDGFNNGPCDLPFAPNEIIITDPEIQPKTNA